MNFFLYSLYCRSLKPFSGSQRMDRMLKRDLASWFSEVGMGSLVFLRMKDEMAGRVLSNISSKYDFS